MRWSTCSVAVLVIIMTTHAHALVLCAPKKGVGVLKVREECRKREVQIDLTDLGVSSPTRFPEWAAGNC